MGEQTDLEQAAARGAQGMALAHWASVQPDHPAVTSPNGDRTFGELNASANRLVRVLRRRGVTAGDSVVLLCGNRPEFVEAMAAAERSGLPITPVNWHLTGPEVAYIAGDCGARVLIADARFAVAATEAAKEINAVCLAVAGGIDGFESYDDAVAAEDATDIDDPVRGSTMLYTSGTTGRPKGVHRDQSAPPTAAAAAIYGYRPATDAHLCTGPLYHAAPLAFSLSAPLFAGTRVVVMDGWDAAETLRLVERERITHTHMVPTMFHRLLALPKEVRAAADLSSLRFVLHGAAPCPVEVKQGLMDWVGPIVWEYYAATEGAATVCDPHTWLAHPGTVGRPLVPGLVMIGDDDAVPLPAGQVGLVWIKAPETGRFRYWGDDAKTEGSYHGEYFTLRDMGYVDADGFLFLTDRSADLIISGGVNIYPAEVDAVLLTHPAVGDAGTVGVPHPEWGEEVLSVIEPATGVDPSEALAEELIDWCRGRLAHFKCPRRIEFVAELPRSDAGKMQRRLLRERYRA
jgi:long-chain acyl-CoA synthetase